MVLGQALAFTTGTFALVNAAITLLWLAVAYQISTRHKQMTKTPARVVRVAAA